MMLALLKHVKFRRRDSAIGRDVLVRHNTDDGGIESCSTGNESLEVFECGRVSEGGCYVGEFCIFDGILEADREFG